MKVVIEECESVHKFWHSKFLAFTLQVEYNRFQRQSKSELYLLGTEPIEGLPEHFLYPLSTEYQVYYRVKQLSLAPEVYLVTIKCIMTGSEILNILLPEIKRALLQQSSELQKMEKYHNYGKIGKALVGVLDVAERVVFSSQVFTVLAGLLLAMLVSFGQQFISADTPTRQKV
jgi:hypothetical protein